MSLLEEVITLIVCVCVRERDMLFLTFMRECHHTEIAREKCNQHLQQGGWLKDKCSCQVDE